MSAAIQEHAARRMVVVFSGGSSDTGIMGVLPSLVSESGVDIFGVFLEDLRLFRLAELPFTIEICRITTLPRPLTTRELERQLRIRAGQTEQALRRIAEQVGSSCSFRTHRGKLSTALADARNVDLLLIGDTRRAFVMAGGASAVARTARRTDLESFRPIAVLFDRTDGGGRALDAGIELATRTRRSLVVFLPDDAAEARSSVLRRLQSVGPGRAVIAGVPNAEPSALLPAVRRIAPVLLVAGAGETGFEEPKIGVLRHGLRCPILVVR